MGSHRISYLLLAVRAGADARCHHYTRRPGETLLLCLTSSTRRARALLPSDDSRGIDFLATSLLSGVWLLEITLPELVIEFYNTLPS
jgi:hypothetical protein